jgi:hypothetical protein
MKFARSLAVALLCGGLVVSSALAGDLQNAIGIYHPQPGNTSDLETSTSWPQILLKGISGDRTGDCLTIRRTGVATTWEFWKTLHPETVVLTNQNDLQTVIRPEFYFTNPYEEYWDERIDPPTWPVSNPDDRLPPQKIILGVHAQNGRAAVVVTDPVAQTMIGDTPVVFFRHDPSGTVFAFENRLDGRKRAFLEHDPDENGFPTFRDTADGSIWNIEGIAIKGAQAGRRLARMPAVQVYWFVWATFFPGSPVELL